MFTDQAFVCLCLYVIHIHIMLYSHILCTDVYLTSCIYYFNFCIIIVSILIFVSIFVAELVRAWDTLPMFEATVCGRS